MSFLMLCSIMAFAITDQQVIDYIKQQTAAGKSEQQIGKELMAKELRLNRRSVSRHSLSLSNMVRLRLRDRR